MLDFDRMISRQRKWMLYLLITFVILVFVFPYPRVANGLLLGGVISYYNLWLLQKKIKMLGERVARGEDPRTGLGTFSRMAAASLGTLITIHYDETFHIIALVVGIVSSYIVIGIDGIARFSKKHKSEKQ